MWKIRLPFLQRRLTEQEFLSRLVTHNSKVACIGAWGGADADPSAAWLVQRVKSKNVSLVDIWDPKLLEKLKTAHQHRNAPELANRIRTLSRETTLAQGVGGLLSYREGLQRMRLRREVSKNAIRLIPRLAWETGIRPRSLNLIVDRGTWGFILDQNREDLRKTVDHYLALLQPQGKIVLFIEDTPRVKRANRELKKALNDLGKTHSFSINKVRIRPSTKTPYRFSERNSIGTRGMYSYSNAWVITKEREK